MGTLTNAYCTLDQLRRDVGGGVIDGNADLDDILARAINAASRQIDQFCGQRFWVDGSVVAREFHADSPSCLDVDDDIMTTGISTVSGLIVKSDDDGDGTFETTWTSSDYLLEPLNAGDNAPARPWTSLRAVGSYSFPRPSNGRPGVQVTAKFGWAAVPDDVTSACILQAGMLYKAKDAAFGVVTFGSGGAESMAMRLRSTLNPIARSLLLPYRKPAVG